MVDDPASGWPHRSVLYQEILSALQPVSGGRYVDGTLGAGGHAWGMLTASAPDGRLLGLDLDPQALELARQRLASFGERAVISQASYTSLADQLDSLGWRTVEGIVLDLGVSSMQLDTPERGFAFQADAPLDMRFSPNMPRTAADLVNTLPEAELARILCEYGEEPQARRIARFIVQDRPLHTTQELAHLVLKATGGGRAARERKGSRSRTGERSHVHPATRTFQALRIAVNGELDAVEQVLPQAVTALAPGGRLAVIAFHSLEDRLVKQFMRRESRDCLCPPRQPVCTCGHRASIKEITRRPVFPQAAEIEENPRSRSARLRVAERI